MQPAWPVYSVHSDHDRGELMYCQSSLICWRLHSASQLSVVVQLPCVCQRLAP